MTMEFLAESVGILDINPDNYRRRPIAENKTVSASNDRNQKSDEKSSGSCIAAADGNEKVVAENTPTSSIYNSGSDVVRMFNDAISTSFFSLTGLTDGNPNNKAIANDATNSDAGENCSISGDSSSNANNNAYASAKKSVSSSINDVETDDCLTSRSSFPASVEDEIALHLAADSDDDGGHKDVDYLQYWKDYEGFNDDDDDDDEEEYRQFLQKISSGGKNVNNCFSNDKTFSYLKDKDERDAKVITSEDSKCTQSSRNVTKEVDDVTPDQIVASELNKSSIASSFFNDNIEYFCKNVYQRKNATGDIFTGKVDSVTGDLVYGTKMYVHSREVYEGPFWHGMRHGENAICTFLDGSGKFIGSYRNDQKYKGTLVTKDSTYTGKFLDNLYHGKSNLLAMSNGTVFEGDFYRGLFHGKGKLSVKGIDNPYTYTGKFRSNLKHGRKGKILYDNGGYEYEGGWKKDVPDGEGVEILRSCDAGSGGATGSSGALLGNSYWSPSIMMATSSDGGEKYEGYFKKGMRQGRGRLTTAKDGMVRAGVWHRGKPVEYVKNHSETVESNDSNDSLNHNNKNKNDGQWILIFKDGTMYEGETLNFRPFGKGKMVYADVNGGIRMTYEGDFRNGLRHGYGRCVFERNDSSLNDKEIYEGDWVADEPVGLKLFQFEEDFPSRTTGLDEKGNTSIKRIEKDVGGMEHVTDVSKGRDVSCKTILKSIGSSIPNQTDMHGSDPRKTIPTYSIKDVDELSACIVSTTGCIAGNSGSYIPEESENKQTQSSSIQLPVIIENSQEPCLVQYSNGDTYFGFLNSTRQRTGHGTYTEHRSGIIYDGEWNLSRRQGKGKTTYPWGIQYEGDYLNDTIEGNGTITLIDGSTYHGSFKNGLFDETGTLEDTFTKRTYVGEFLEGKFEGTGEETFDDGTRYNGEYRNGKRSGTGTLVQIDSQGQETLIYRGKWANDQIEGEGRYVYWNGAYYEGKFCKGQRSGRGVYHKEDGWEIEGEWEENKPMSGDWVIKHNNGSVYYGSATTGDCMISDDGTIESLPLPNGFGTHKNSQNGELFTGAFVNGKKSGMGVCVFPNGDKWDGEWRRDVFVRYARKRP